MAIPSELIAEALKLSADDREDLAHTLLESLDAESSSRNDNIELTPEQEAELDASIAEADRGEGVSWDVVRDELRRR
jgi:putative addiction module component (TIGR02574 family)